MATAVGVRYQARSGTGEGMRLVRQGSSRAPAQFRPTTVPRSESGSETKSQIRSRTTIEPKGTAASDWYPIAIVFSTAATAKTAAGKRLAARSIAAIQARPSWRA